MANRRMFSSKVIDTDLFLEMSATSQLLYFHLAMRADDDGFVSSPKRTLKMLGMGDDDLRVLIAKKFILPFQSGVCVIRHWRIHNLLRGDRYTETQYVDEKSELFIGKDGSYSLENITGETLESKKIQKPYWLINREEKIKESDLPCSFDYKIKQAFWGKPCPICNTPMQNLLPEQMEYGTQLCNKPSIQHNIPLSKGGKHELGNISIICHSCNVSIRDKETSDLNAEEVTKTWLEINRQPIGNQSAPQVRIGKDRIGKKNILLGKPNDVIIFNDIEVKKPGFAEEDYSDEAWEAEIMFYRKFNDLPMTPSHPLLPFLAMMVLKNLNIWTGSRFRPVEANLKPIMQRLSSGATSGQCYAINGKKHTEWGLKGIYGAENPMAKYLRPKTLYAKENFEQYLGELAKGAKK